MSPTSPVSTESKPMLNRAESDAPQTPFSPASNATSSSPGSPRPRYARIAASEPTIFARIRTTRSRSRSANRSNSTPTSTSSPTSPSEERRQPCLHLRSDSGTSNASSGRSRSQKRNSGTVMQVGRHGNDWLFGGFSFTEAVRGLLSPTGSGNDNN